uniref:Transposase n=1 Tax=Heterorhabditis bacteriophora TaxID=37862 RepID=A0A1I7X2L7_HETBA
MTVAPKCKPFSDEMRWVVVYPAFIDKVILNINRLYKAKITVKVAISGYIVF